MKSAGVRNVLITSSVGKLALLAIISIYIFLVGHVNYNNN